MKQASELVAQLEGKRVLFITTKNVDYIRNTQEINAISNVAGSVILIGSNAKSYPKRLLYVYRKIIQQRMDKIDVTFVGFAPQLVVPIFKRKFKKTTLVIDFFISVYDTMVMDRKKFSPRSRIGSICKQIDKKTLKFADEIICDTEAHGDYFIDELGAKQDHTYVWYLEADKSIYYPRPVKEKLPNEANKVLYFGSILPLQGVPVIFDAMRQFAGDKTIQFDFIGPIGSNQNEPYQENINYINWLSQEELANRIADADLCLAGHFSGDILKAVRTIPGKAYIYEAMNKPMILGDGTANHELFKEDDRHIFVKMGDSDALAQAIRDYFS